MGRSRGGSVRVRTLGPVHSMSGPGPNYLGPGPDPGPQGPGPTPGQSNSDVQLRKTYVSIDPTVISSISLVRFLETSSS